VLKKEIGEQDTMQKVKNIHEKYIKTMRKQRTESKMTAEDGIEGMRWKERGFVNVKKISLTHLVN